MELMCWSQRHLSRVSLLLCLCLGFVRCLPAQSAISAFQSKKVGTVKIQADGPVDEEFLLNLIEITPNVDIVTTPKIRKSIELLYETGNFTNVLVDAEMRENRVHLTFILRLVYRIKFVGLRGDLGISTQKIRKKILLRKREPFTPEKVLRARSAILSILEDNGYYNAGVVQDVLLHRTGKTAEIVYTVNAGPGAYVGSVTFTGSPHFRGEELQLKMKSLPGRRFRQARLDRDLAQIEQIYDSNGFLEHDIRVVKQELDAGNRMNLEIQINAGRQLVLNTAGFEISQKTIQKILPIWIEHSYNDDTLEEGKRSLVEYLQSKGYYDANVTWEKDLTGPEIRITYKIEAGQAYKVSQISIEGNDHVTDGEILEIMTTDKSGSFGAQRLVSRIFESDLERVISFYRERGFLFAHWTRNEVIRHPQGTIDLDLAIDEGPQVLLSEIRLKGNTKISSETLLHPMVLQPGASISESKVKQDSNTIVSLYSDRGYPKMKLENRLLLSRDKTKAVVEYKIEEGEQIFVDRIVINGNDRTKRDVISENLFFDEDEPFSLLKIIASQSKLYSLNIFDRVDIETPRPDSLQEQQDVLIHLTEAKPYTISYGFGYQTFDKLRGIFSFSNRNLYGTARTIALQLRGGIKEGRALLSYVDPHLLFHKVNSTLTGFAERGVRESFDFTRYGVRFQAEKKLSTESIYLRSKQEPSKSLFFGYLFEDVDTTGTPSLDPIDRQFLAIHISGPSASFVRDARDNPVDPLTGNFFSSDLQYASSYLGSGTDFLESFSQFQYYLPVRKSVVATSLRIGLAKGFRETVGIPLSQRFFAGGGRTIRGFALDTAGPLDENGEPLGGNVLFILNLEYRFPIHGNLGGVVFFDYGNVYDLLSNFDFSELRKTAGIGIRYKTPIGPLTVDWGYKLDRKFEPIRESPSEFFISVGHAF